MNIEVFTLCDAATADGGKLNMLGAFDTIWVKETPIVYPHCVVALRVRFHLSERGEHQVSLKFIDIDGKNVIPPSQGPLKIDFPPEQQSGAANLILNIQGLKLERCGEYSIDLTIDGQARGSLPLFVRKRS